MPWPTHSRFVAVAIAVVFIWLVIIGLSSQAQDASPLRRTVIVHVWDKSQRAVPGLGPANFRGEVGGKPARIVAAEPDNRAHRVLLLIDTGRSLRASGALDVAWKVADDLIGTLSKQHAVSVWTVGKTLSRFADFTTDQAALQRALREAQIRTTSSEAVVIHLRYPVLQVAQQFPEPQPGDLICVITDDPGLWYDFRTYQEVADEARNEYVSRSLRLFVVLVRGPSGGLGAGWYEYQRSGLQAAEATGGGWLAFGYEVDRVHTTLGSLYEEILNTYRVDIELPEPVTKLKPLKLEIVDAAGKKAKDVKVSYPRVFLPLPVSR